MRLGSTNYVFEPSDLSPDLSNAADLYRLIGCFFIYQMPDQGLRPALEGLFEELEFFRSATRPLLAQAPLPSVELEIAEMTRWPVPEIE